MRPRRSLAASGRLLTAAATAADGAACADHSEVSETTIIRTTDSRALGAKFLNESSLGPDSRDRCLAMCCAFRGCNVAVYEEKVIRLTAQPSVPLHRNSHPVNAFLLSQTREEPKMAHKSPYATRSWSFT